MNDWSYNTLWISTSSSDLEHLSELDRLVQELQDPDDYAELTFFNHCNIPDCLIETYGDITPEVEADNERSCGYRFLHQFTKAEWGCVYDASDVVMGHDDDEMAFYTFRTPSTAPLAWLAKVSSQYPHLLFELEATNELDLWDSFVTMYVGGSQVDYRHDKKQNNKYNA